MRVGDDARHNEQRSEVKQNQSPEDLFRSFRNSFSRVVGFCSGKANQFGSRHGERRGDERRT